MIRALTWLPYESRTNRYVARVAVWPDKACTRGHATTAAVLHIKSNEPNRRPFTSKKEQKLGERGDFSRHVQCRLRQPLLRFIARPRPSRSCAPTVHLRLRPRHGPVTSALSGFAPSLCTLGSPARSLPCSRTRDKEWDTIVSRHLQ